MGGRKRGGEGEGATEQGLVLCLEVIPKASHHIQLDKGIGEISVCVSVSLCVSMHSSMSACTYCIVYKQMSVCLYVCVCYM